MRIPALPLVALLCALLSSAPATVAGGTFTERHGYSASPTGVDLWCMSEPCPDVNENVATLSPFFLSSTVGVTIADATRLPVGASYEVRDPVGNLVGSGSFCGSVSGIGVPADHLLRVYVDTVPTTTACPGGVGGLYGTVTFTVTF